MINFASLKNIQEIYIQISTNMTQNQLFLITHDLFTKKRINMYYDKLGQALSHEPRHKGLFYNKNQPLGRGYSSLSLSTDKLAFVYELIVAQGSLNMFNKQTNQTISYQPCFQIKAYLVWWGSSFQTAGVEAV